MHNVRCSQAKVHCGNSVQEPIVTPTAVKPLVRAWWTQGASRHYYSLRSESNFVIEVSKSTMRLRGGTPIL